MIRSVRQRHREAARELAAKIVEQAGDDACSLIRLRMADRTMMGAEPHLNLW